ncbi:hypothetical protein bcgnr5378_08700 [Bacillus cereus]
MNKLSNGKNNKTSSGIELDKRTITNKDKPSHAFEEKELSKELNYGEVYFEENNGSSTLVTSLIHGTSYEAILGIKKDQELIPNKIKSSYAVEEGYHEAEDFYGYLFFTNRVETAIHNSSYATHNISIKHPLPDGLYFALEIEIPESKLESDNSLAKDWKESLDLSMSVKVKGNIPASWVKKVLLCHYEIDNVLIKCTLDNLEEVLKQYKDLFLHSHTVIDAVSDRLLAGKLPITII